MIRAALIIVLVFAVEAALASGPTTPKGWDGSFEPTLPTGQACCIPADLNGTNLTGGAFVLLTSNKKEFGVFALTYTADDKEHWQLLERHPIALLDSYRVSVEEKPHKFPFEYIRVCVTGSECVAYYTSSARGRFKRSREAKNER